MNININSWHYKACTMLGETAPTNLCPYVRRVVANLSISLIMVIFSVTIVASVWTALLWTLPWFYVDTSGVLFLIGAPACLFAILLFLGHLLQTVVLPKYRAYKKICTEAPSEPNIFTEYARAVKNKICPVIEFVDHD